jgi:hypothetical protein
VIPKTNPAKKHFQNLPTKIPRKGSENHRKDKRDRHNQTLRNHVESSIHTTKIHTRSSLPPDHTSLSQNLTMKLSS